MVRLRTPPQKMALTQLDSLLQKKRVSFEKKKHVFPLGFQPPLKQWVCAYNHRWT